MQNNHEIPCITIDGGAATGKGTVRRIVANHFGFHELDSGALYRTVGLNINPDDLTNTDRLIAVALSINVMIKNGRTIVNGVDRTEQVHSEETGRIAKVVAAIPEVRAALRTFQLGMRKAPGLVADGRDQGDIFAKSKRFFLEASPHISARRRFDELCRREKPADLESVRADIERRDSEDRNRPVSPLRPHPHAWIIDTDPLNAEEVAGVIIQHTKVWAHQRGIMLQQPVAA